MRKKKLIGKTVALLTVMVMIFVMTGCNKEKPAEQSGGNVTEAPAASSPAPTATAEPTSAATEAPSPTEEVNETTPTPGGNKAEITNVPVPDAGIDVSTIPPVPDADGVYHVRSIKELIGAIGPDTAIVIEPGYYNLTDYLSEYNNDGNRMIWNQAHQYVQIIDVFDGVELQIKNVEKLSIGGGDDDRAKTEIVTEPRYASLFSFKNCKEISLSNLTMGHTDTGDCSGNVIDLYSSCWFTLNNMDLYGCGVNGLGSYEGSGDVYITDSTIRDCSYGPFEIYDPDGAYEFRNCVMTGSGWGGAYWPTDTSAMRFIKCEFGQYESNEWCFRDDVYFEDCKFEDPSEYPDYGDYDDDYDYYVPPVPEVDDLTQFSIGDEMLLDIYWVAWQEYHADADTFTQMDYFSYEADQCIGLSFYAEPEHTGMVYLGGDAYEMNWRFEDTDFLSIEFGDRRWFASMYVDKNGNLDTPEPEDRWLCVWTDTGRELWCYKY